MTLMATAAAVASALGSRWAVGHAHRHALVDLPGERRSHAVPTPRGGGIGIAIVCMIALVLLGAGSGNPPAWQLVASGLMLVALVGWWDDHRPLSIPVRLMAHVLAAACLAWSMRLQGAGIPAVLAAFVSALVLVNAWNFIDGINGMATSQALLCATAYAVLLDAGWRSSALILAATCVGFLPFNFPRARVFLGDVGSGSLGYMVAALLAANMLAKPVQNWPVLLLPLLVVLVDTGLTLSRRAVRGEAWWQPHVQHAYQRWSRRRGHVPVMLSYAAWTAGTSVLMLVALRLPKASMPGVVALAALSTACAWSCLQRRCLNAEIQGTRP